jgi:predicted ATPase
MSFIGRESELDEAASASLASRLVTLVGPGGVGKSRLAAQAGAAFVDKFPDGAWMFEFAPLTDSEGLEALMIATLGLYGSAGRVPRDVLFERLESARALLIMDNCEHVLSVVARLIEDLLGMGPAWSCSPPVASRFTSRGSGW